MRDLGNIVVAKALKSCPICKKITQSGHTAPSLFYIPTRYVFIELTLPSDILLYLLCILSLSCTPSPSFSLTHSLARTHTISLSLSLLQTPTHTLIMHEPHTWVSEWRRRVRWCFGEWDLFLEAQKSSFGFARPDVGTAPSAMRTRRFYLPTYLCAYIFAYRPTYLHLPAPLGRHTLLLKVLPYFSLGKFSAHGEVPIPSRTFSCGRKCSFYFYLRSRNRSRRQRRRRHRRQLFFDILTFVSNVIPMMSSLFWGKPITTLGPNFNDAAATENWLIFSRLSLLENFKQHLGYSKQTSKQFDLADFYEL